MIPIICVAFAIGCTDGTNSNSNNNWPCEFYCQDRCASVSGTVMPGTCEEAGMLCCDTPDEWNVAPNENEEKVASENEEKAASENEEKAASENEENANTNADDASFDNKKVENRNSGALDKELYTALTADGVSLKIQRYRPSGPNGVFRTNGQPILLLPGIGENLNVFTTHTPEAKKEDYSDMELPDPLASWAVNDPYIKEDPMMYYSIAYYLWLKGYDVWLGNYRGVGRGEYRSDAGDNKLVNLDVWAALDTPAFVDKVKSETGKDPIIGGHSTGGLVCYLYLSGITMDADEFKSAQGAFVPHVEFDATLAAKRNNTVKGLIGLDPAGVPPLPFVGVIDMKPVWRVLQTPKLVNMDKLVENNLSDSNLKWMPFWAIGTFFRTIGSMAEVTNIQQQYDLFGALAFWKVKDMNKYTIDFFLRYAAGSFYLRGFAEYTDWGVHNVQREFWENGAENEGTIVPPDSGDSNDNLVYYLDNISNVIVPTICIFFESDGLVSTSIMVKNLMNLKTPQPDDEWYEIPGTAHVDIPLGNRAPALTFVMIGDWLDKVSSK